MPQDKGIVATASNIGLPKACIVLASPINKNIFAVRLGRKCHSIRRPSASRERQLQWPALVFNSSIGDNLYCTHNHLIEHFNFCNSDHQQAMKFLCLISDERFMATASNSALLKCRFRTTFLLQNFYCTLVMRRKKKSYGAAELTEFYFRHFSNALTLAAMASNHFQIKHQRQSSVHEWVV